MRQGMTKQLSTAKGVEGREKVPEKACGKCSNFSENAYASDGRGFCGVVKVGSDILADPPVFVLEGNAGMMCMFNMDAARCVHYKEMEFIDTDGTECADPQFRRAQRQMEKVLG
jgi:hypothetical protein